MTKDVISGITKDSYFEAFLNAKSNKYTDMNIEKIHVMLYNTMEQI